MTGAKEWALAFNGEGVSFAHGDEGGFLSWAKLTALFEAFATGEVRVEAAQLPLLDGPGDAAGGELVIAPAEYVDPSNEREDAPVRPSAGNDPVRGRRRAKCPGCGALHWRGRGRTCEACPEPAAKPETLSAALATEGG